MPPLPLRSLAAALSVALLAVALLAVALLAAPAAAQEAAPAARHILVDGQGEATATPDSAMISAGVETRAPSAAEAMRRNSEAMERVFQALREAGVADRSIRTSTIQVTPVYDHSRDQPDQPEPIAFQATNQVAVTSADLGRLGALIDALVSAGANRIDGVQFTIEQPEALEDEARRQAIADARRKAELYAEAAGVAVGAVLHIEERGVNRPMPRMMAMAESARDVPVAPGEQTVEAVVSVRFAIAE